MNQVVIAIFGIILTGFIYSSFFLEDEAVELVSPISTVAHNDKTVKKIEVNTKVENKDTSIAQSKETAFSKLLSKYLVLIIHDF